MNKSVLIVGLGNPGERYQNTRHNIGAIFNAMLSRRFNVNLREHPKFLGDFTSFNYKEKQVFLLNPQTFMNRSGQSVQLAVKYYKIQTSNIFVVHDDLDIKNALIKLKFSGGDGGHNGLKDITKALNSNEYYRIRIGIGRPHFKEQVSDFVLSNPSIKEAADLQDSLQVFISDYLESVICGDINIAMQKLHSK